MNLTTGRGLEYKNFCRDQEKQDQGKTERTDRNADGPVVGLVRIQKKGLEI